MRLCRHCKMFPNLVQASAKKSSKTSSTDRLQRTEQQWLKDTGLTDVAGRRMPNDDRIDPFHSFHVVPRAKARKEPLSEENLEQSKLSSDELKQAVNRFRLLDQDHMRNLNRFFSTNSLMRTIFDIGTRALLGGGIAFEKKHHFTTAMTAKLFENVWEQFVRDLLKSLWVYGFALCITRSDEHLVAVPLVLPLEQLQVRYYQDPFGQRRYAANMLPDDVTMSLGLGMFNSAAGDSSSGSMPPVHPGGLDSLIPGITVFEMSPPLADGTLTSNVSTVLQDFRQHDTVMEQYVRHTVHHAVPPIFIRQDLPKGADGGPASMNVHRADFASDLNAGSAAAAMPNVDIQIAPEVQQELHLINRHGVRSVGAARAIINEHKLMGQQVAVSSTGAIPTYELPPFRVLDKPAMGKEPSHVEYFHRALEIRVAAVFGIPADLFGEPKGNRSGNVDHRMIYHDAMRGIRQLMQSCLYRMYLHIYGESTLSTYVATHNSYTLEQLQADTDVHVTLPGILPTELITEWRMEGILDHKTYVAMLARSYSLPVSVFTTAPEVSLKDLLKIKPEPTGPSSSSSSSTKKKSSSSSSSATSAATKRKRVEASAAGSLVSRSAATGIPAWLLQSPKRRHVQFEDEDEDEDEDGDEDVHDDVHEDEEQE